MKSEHYYMQRARAQAARSLASNEVPVGAIVVDESGAIIGRGYNRMEAAGTQQAHAEMRALAAAAKKRGNWRLDNCTLYITLEPCAMCMGCALLSRVGSIVFGAYSDQFGATGIFEQLPEQYRAHTIIRGGLQQEECVAMLKHFFAQVRANAKETS